MQQKRTKQAVGKKLNNRKAKAPATMTTTESPFGDVRWASDFLSSPHKRIGVQRVYQLVRDQIIPPSVAPRLGRNQILIDKQALREWLRAGGWGAAAATAKESVQ